MDKKERIFRELNNPRYKWRTINGISKATGISQDEVTMVIASNAETVVQSSALSPAGETLFTTRKKHSKESSTFSRLTSALRNRAD